MLQQHEREWRGRPLTCHQDNCHCTQRAPGCTLTAAGPLAAARLCYLFALSPSGDAPPPQRRVPSVIPAVITAPLRPLSYAPSLPRRTQRADNEVILDAAVWSANMPSTIDAMFFQVADARAGGVHGWHAHACTAWMDAALVCMMDGRVPTRPREFTAVLEGLPPPLGCAIFLPLQAAEEGGQGEMEVWATQQRFLEQYGVEVPVLKLDFTNLSHPFQRAAVSTVEVDCRYIVC